MTKDTEQKTVRELAGRYLAIKGQPNGFSTRDARMKKPSPGLRITGDGDSLQIEYRFSRKEIRILQLLTEVTGVSMEWHANDAIMWTRAYIDELLIPGDGNLFDLIDLEEGGVAPVPKSHRRRARLFIQRIREERRNWFQRNQN